MINRNLTNFELSKQGETYNERKEQIQHSRCVLQIGGTSLLWII